LPTSKNVKAKRPVIAFRIAPELRAALEALAKSERRTLNAYVSIILEDHVAAVTPKRKPK
jgi:hypothetical protein